MEKDKEKEIIIKSKIISNIKIKDKSYIDKIPEKYKRDSYIIDKLNCKIKRVDK